MNRKQYIKIIEKRHARLDKIGEGRPDSFEAVMDYSKALDDNWESDIIYLNYLRGGENK
jgi:hypothetical protein